jgi:hypothetical protein
MIQLPLDMKEKLLPRNDIAQCRFANLSGCEQEDAFSVGKEVAVAKRVFYAQLALKNKVCFPDNPHRNLVPISELRGHEHVDQV